MRYQFIHHQFNSPIQNASGAEYTIIYAFLAFNTQDSRLPRWMIKEKMNEFIHFQPKTFQMKEIMWLRKRDINDCSDGRWWWWGDRKAAINFSSAN